VVIIGCRSRAVRSGDAGPVTKPSLCSALTPATPETTSGSASMASWISPVIGSSRGRTSRHDHPSPPHPDLRQLLALGHPATFD